MKQQTIFTIRNAGFAGFYYTWNVKDSPATQKIDITFKNKDGFVPSESEIEAFMCITPLTKVILKKLKIKLEVILIIIFTFGSKFIFYR